MSHRMYRCGPSSWCCNVKNSELQIGPLTLDPIHRRAAVTSSDAVIRVRKEDAAALAEVETLVIPGHVRTFLGLSRFPALRVVSYAGDADVFGFGEGAAWLAEKAADPAGVTDSTVYSTLPEGSLYKDGHLVETQKGDKVFVFKEPITGKPTLAARAAGQRRPARRHRAPRPPAPRRTVLAAPAGRHPRAGGVQQRAAGLLPAERLPLPELRPAQAAGIRPVHGLRGV